MLDVEGVGYRAGMMGKNLVVMVGYSHPVEIVPPHGHRASRWTRPDARSPSPASTSRWSARWPPRSAACGHPEPYKGKGIRYRGEKVRQKAGKSGKVGGKGKK